MKFFILSLKRTTLCASVILLIFSSTLVSCANYPADWLYGHNEIGARDVEECVITCVYNVSGAYTQLQRILFYTALAFTFCFRFHDWLTAAGIAFIVTYSSTAAIHGFGLSLQHHTGLDLDNIAVQTLVSRGALGAIIFAIYTKQLLGTNPTALCITWSALLAISSTVFTVTMPQFWQNMQNSAFNMPCDDLVKAGTFQSPCAEIPSQSMFRDPRDQTTAIFWGSWISSNASASSSSDPGHSNVSHDTSPWVNIIICGTMIDLAFRSSLVNITFPPATARNFIFRRLAVKRTIQTCALSENRLFAAKGLAAIYYIWRTLTFVLWPLVILEIIFYCALSCCCAGFLKSMQKSCGCLRCGKNSWIFCSVEKRHIPSKTRQWFAKAVAMTWYIWAWSTYLVLPATYVFLVVWDELLITGMPESEAPRAVGQWGPWVGVGLAVFAAIISQIVSRFSPIEER